MGRFFKQDTADAPVLGQTFTLFGQPASPGPLAADAAFYTLGIQFSVSRAAQLSAIWFYSGAGALALPTIISLFTVTGAALVHQEAASWSGALASGWVRAPFSAPPFLAAGTAYKACITQPTAVNWYSHTTGDTYWTTGPGSGGITNGILSAPNNAGASPGQDSFINSATLAYPTSGFGANYWIDPEVYG